MVICWIFSNRRLLFCTGFRPCEGPLYDCVRGDLINAWDEMVSKGPCSVDKVEPPSKYGYDKDAERGWKSA